MLALAFWRNAAGAARPAAGAAHPRAVRPWPACGWRDLRSSVVAGLFLAGALRRLAAEPVDDVGRRVGRAGHHHPDLDGAGRPDHRGPAAGRGLVGAAAGRRRCRADRRRRRHGVAARRWPATGWRCWARSPPAGYVLAGARARQRLATSAYAVVCYSTCAVVIAVAAAGRRRPAGRVQRPRLVADRRHHRRAPSCSGTRCSTWCCRRSGRPWSASRSCSRCPARCWSRWCCWASCRRCWRCPGWPLVVVGVALVVRACRPPTATEPIT